MGSSGGSTAVSTSPPRGGWRAFPFFEARLHGPLAVAHRGGLEAPGESLLATVDRTLDAGIRFLELDLRATAAGDLVVWHGRGIERLRPGKPVTADLVERAGPPWFEELLEAVPSDVGFFVDLKDRGAGEALARVLERTGIVERVCIGSFSHARTWAAALAVERVCGARVPTAATPREVCALLVRGATGRHRAAPSPSAQIERRMATPRVIHAAHAGGALVVPWTVNDAATMHALLERGVDGLISDEPERLRSVLEERGAWSGAGVSPGRAGETPRRDTGAPPRPRGPLHRGTPYPPRTGGASP